MSLLDQKKTVEEMADLLEDGKSYVFEIVDIIEQPGLIVGRNAPEGIRGKMLSEISAADREGINDKWVADYITIRLKPMGEGQEGTDFAIKDSFAVAKVGVDKSNAPRNTFSRFLKALGANVGKNVDIYPNQFIKRGARVTATIKREAATDGSGKTYAKIVQDSYKPATGGSAGQATLTTDPKIKAEIEKIVTGSGTKTVAMKKLVDAGRADLIDHFVHLFDAGQIKL